MISYPPFCNIKKFYFRKDIMISKNNERKQEMNWRSESFRLTGKRHRENEIACQDHTASREQPGRYSISLVDGIGKTDINAKFGELMAEYINYFLQNNYEHIRETDEETIAYNLMLNVENILEQKCREFMVNKKELSSTLLGAVVDSETNTFCLIHLGDGVIAGRAKNDQIILLSKPLNGSLSNETVLSTSENALGYVKVRRGSLENIKEIMLVSDGIYNSHSDLDKLRKCFFQNDVHDILRETMDDQSFIKLSRI